ncbi:hypothetical protein [Candidatus Poriferisodalis sp.]|uniref:hypothetical protein n=1 Tax=Candidatus Poriferisodalis sp. TaxID=3101277 RepID=UPI003B58F0F6
MSRRRIADAGECRVSGPGLLNTAAALSTAYATNAPVLKRCPCLPMHSAPRRLSVRSGAPSSSMPGLMRAGEGDQVIDTFRRT